MTAEDPPAPSNKPDSEVFLIFVVCVGRAHVVLGDFGVQEGEIGLVLFAIIGCVAYFVYSGLLL